jgi:hypothetical protein
VRLYTADPRADLKALGLNPDYETYAGTAAWSSGTGIADGFLVNAIQGNLSPFQLAGFYLRRLHVCGGVSK